MCVLVYVISIELYEEWCSYLFHNHGALYQQVNSVYMKTLIMKVFRSLEIVFVF